MGRRRASKLDLPPRVYLKHGAYYHVTRDNKWVRLSTDRAEACAKWAKLQGIDMPSNTVGDLLRRYLTEVSPLKSPRTRRDDETAAQLLIAVFGEMTPASVTPAHVAGYLDRRGAAAPTRANRETALLSHAFTKAIRWGLVERNPCRGVERLPERKRERYVSDAEFDSCRQAAGEPLGTMMEFALLTAMRQDDMLGLRMSNLTDEGIDHVQGKTGTRLVIAWSDELRAVVERAMQLHQSNRAQRSSYLFARRGGGRYSQSGFQTLWQRVQRRWGEAGNERFTWHDLRAKALTDADAQGGNAQALAGHASAQMTQRYIKQKRVKRADPLRRTAPR